MGYGFAFTEHVVPLRTPLRTGWGLLERRTLFTVELTAPDGLVGRGEAAPLEAYDGVSDAECRDALVTLGTALAGADTTRPAHELLPMLQAECDCAQALAAVDLALWDLAGRRTGRPVAQLIEASAAESVAVQATFGGDAPEVVAERGAAAAAAGFTAFKLKVGLRASDGSADLDGDVARTAALREAVGPAARIKVDANGAWSVPEALQALDRLCAAPLRVAAVEEPVSGGDAWPHLRAAVNAAGHRVELSIDETADREPGAIARGADVVELKLARTGGIGPMLVQAAVVGLAGAGANLASTYDGPLGIVAAVHVAAALGIERPLGLATLGALDFSAVPELAELAARLKPVGGRIAVPAGPGLL